MRKSPERCIYCGAKAKITREHIFGKWLKPHVYSRNPNTTHITTFSRPDPTTGAIVSSMAKGTLNRTGSPHVQHLKLVCSQCNETWMGTIQNQAKPYLLELLEGRWPFADAASVRCVAAWATMVTTSIEFADPQTNSSNQEERTKFMADLAPGDNWLVYVGLCHPAMDVGAFWHRGARLPLEGIPEGVAETPNMQTTTFYFGRSFFHTLRVPDELLPNPETYAAEIGIRQIWPIPAAIPGQSLVFTGPGVTRIGGVYWLYLGLNPDPSGGMFIHTGN